MRVAAAVFSMIIATLFFAQPVLADESSDKVMFSDSENDLRICGFHNAGYAAWGPAFGGLGPSWPDNSPVQNADYLDMKEASLEKQGDTFVMTMTLWCDDLMEQVDLPLRAKGGLAIWTFGLTNPDTGYHWEIMIAWDGSDMLKFCYPTDFTLSIVGATITISFDESMMEDPASLVWGAGTMLCLSPPWLPITGGFWWTDLPDCVDPQSPWFTWPAAP